nr:nuclear transport factor 2 family protein [Pedobacter sp. ASV2]
MKFLFICSGLITLTVFATLQATAQQQTNIVQKDDPLYQKVVVLDSAMFSAYNKRNLKEFMDFFSPDLEFYDDRSGLTDYIHNFAAFKMNLTNPVHSSRRELVKGSLEVYRLGNFGALAIGIHKFYGTVSGKEELEATAKFTEVWENKNGKWKVKREMSYDHK